jgi:hypothetical protein
MLAARQEKTVAIRYYCGHCGQETRPDARVCPNCGGLLYQMARATTPETDVPTLLPGAQPYPGTQPIERVPGLWHWFLARSLPLKIALVLALAASLSPVLWLVAIIGLFVCAAVVLVRLLMRRPWRS